jgi:hypothetical protein
MTFGKPSFRQRPSERLMDVNVAASIRWEPKGNLVRIELEANATRVPAGVADALPGGSAGRRLEEMAARSRRPI